jgi:creatinine amidohydrolase
MGGTLKLQLMTWTEVEDYLALSDGIVIPVGSTEQHGPIGLIGTDALCAEAIAVGAAERAQAIVAPTIALTPAPFNMHFPGTMSVSTSLFQNLVSEVLAGLKQQGFGRFYFLNAHGANLAPLNRVAESDKKTPICIRSWWDFEPVNVLRRAFFGNWEGMHATPSEVSITQALHRIVPMHPAAKDPPRPLTDEFIQAHSGDRHGPPDQHRAAFPDGRVGAHSALATPEFGQRILEAAQTAVAADMSRFFAQGE